MRNIIILLSTCFSALSVYSQYCTPSANCSDGDYINNFSFNTINNLSSDANDCDNLSYTNTGLSTSVDAGNSYTVTLQSGPNFEQGFGVWIDYNGDNDFDDANEFAFWSPSSTTDLVTGTITIPASVSSVTTRMRVRSKYNQVPFSYESCSSFSYGETEDYTITIIENTLPPEANFTSNTNGTCSGQISFIDMSANNPSSWLWDFGDGNTSTLQNPNHTYALDGTYTVTLTVTNSFGSDNITFTDFITVSSSGNTPISASCTPQTTNGVAQFGITKFELNTIHNSSADALAGYEDFTCFFTELYAGNYYPISVFTDNGQAHNVKVWIDYNNDGSFTSTELITSGNQQLVTSDTVFIPSNVITNTPLRLRVAADYYLQPEPEACTDLSNGQAEDYTVIILPNTFPPVTSFEVNSPLICDSLVHFTDLSTNVPTSWLWNFGDGNTSTQQNPSYHYDTSGTYTVTLIATNAFGSDTFSITNAVTVNYNGQLNAASCMPETSTPCCGYGIYSVRFNTINKGSGGSDNSYSDYSCENSTIINAGSCYEIEVRTGAENKEDVKAWIDFNNDGNFDDVTETIFFSADNNNHIGIVNIPSSGVVFDTPLRLRLMSESSGNAISPCNNLLFGETEDYAVTISIGTSLPSVFFEADETESCDGFVNFTNLSCGGAIGYLWDFGDGTTSTVQNPTHIYTGPGAYDVTLAITNASGTSSLTKPAYVQVLSLLGAPADAQCEPQTISPFEDLGIRHFYFGTINKWSQPGSDGYQDYSCSDQTIVETGAFYAFGIETSVNYEETVRIWIDYNNDGSFNNNDELVHASTQTEIHTGGINIPTDAPTDITLRMRVWSDFPTGFTVYACDEPEYGQVEDYAIIVQDASSPPLANFSVDSTINCMGTVNFENSSSSSATSYLWNFGDGSTSTSFEPSHTYTNFGNYDVSLTVSNANGSNTLNYPNAVQYIEDCSLVGIPLLVSVSDFNVYPNPTNSVLNVESKLIGDYTFDAQFVNQMGQIMQLESQQNNNTLSFDVSNLSKGVYFLQISSTDFSSTQKVIIQ